MKYTCYKLQQKREQIRILQERKIFNNFFFIFKMKNTIIFDVWEFSKKINSLNIIN